MHYVGSAERIFGRLRLRAVNRTLAVGSDPMADPTSHRLVRPRVIVPSAAGARGTRENSDRHGDARIAAKPRRLAKASPASSMPTRHAE